MSLSNTLKELRKVRGFTLLDIAKKMDVTEATVQRWESGNIKNMKYGNIVKLAEILDVNPAVLMGWQTEPPKDAQSSQASQNLQTSQNMQKQPTAQEVQAQAAVQEVHTIAAHHDGTDWTEEELDEIEQFKKYILSKRKKK